MIVSATTGQYDDSIEYSAWDLAADGWWEELGYSAQIVGGRALYELAGSTRHKAPHTQSIGT